MTEIEKPPAENTQRGMLLPLAGITTLCLAAVIAQSAGLFSVVRYVSKRESWDAQKQQYSEVSAEWESMSAIARGKIDAQKQRETEAEQLRASKEKELELVQSQLAKTKGELQALQDTASSAVELQKRAELERQDILDEVQNLKQQLADLQTEQADLQTKRDVAASELSAAQSRLQTNKATLDSQSREIQSSQEQLSMLDASLKTSRQELRQTNEALVQANDDLTNALVTKKQAVAAAETANNLLASVDDLKTQKTQLEGELAALGTQKVELEKELATATSRISVAETRLAEYLNMWNNRDALNREMDALMERVKTLKQTESTTVSNIAKLNEQSVKLETKTKDLASEVQEAEENLKKLQQQQQETLASLMELRKLQQGAGKPGGEGSSEEDTTESMNE